MWWWLSFADPSKPKGQQFLGVAIVEAPLYGLALEKAWELKINPGGEVMGYITDEPDAKYANRLLSEQELLESGIGEKIVRTSTGVRKAS